MRIIGGISFGYSLRAFASFAKNPARYFPAWENHVHIVLIKNGVIYNLEFIQNNIHIKNHTARRERERKELRLRILDAARALFVNGGETAVTLRGVAERIEFSPTAIYAHFSNKEALVWELCESEFASFARSLQQADHLPDAMERLRKTAMLYVDFGLQYPEHYRVLMLGKRTGQAGSSATVLADRRIKPTDSVASEQAAAVSQEFRMYDYLHRAVFKAMAASCFKPEYRDVELLAQIVWSCVHGVVALHLVRAQCPKIPWKPVQNIVDASLESLFNGMTTPSCQIPPTWRR